MAKVIVTASAVPAAMGNNLKPQKLFRGVTRTMIRKTLAKLRALQSRDTREHIHAGIKGYQPALVQLEHGSKTARAFDDVIERLALCLTRKTGEE